MRVVLDSNVLISAFATKGLCADLFRDILGSHDLLVSNYILNEVTEKLLLRLKVPKSVVNSIKQLLREFVIDPQGVPDADLSIRDPDDIPIVIFALAVSADVLITGDRDLLDIAGKLPVRVITPRNFYEQ
ncbi:MAG: putative toxin-antitoxin system toxin component, PIN family [Chthoniobacterales bacterium]